MRKKIPKGIIICVSLSSIITFMIAHALLQLLKITFGQIDGVVVYSIFFVFLLVNIITFPFLILLKNWARITHIRIHMIFFLLILFMFCGLFLFGSTFDFLGYLWPLFLLFPFLLIYSMIAIYYFDRPDIAKLFKQ